MSFMPIADAAKRMGVTPRTIQRKVANGELDASRGTDGRTLVMVDDVTDKLAAVGAVQAKQRDVDQRQLDMVVSLARDTQRGAESRARRATAGVLVAIAAVVALGYAYHRDTLSLSVTAQESRDMASSEGKRADDLATRLEGSESDRKSLRGRLSDATEESVRLRARNAEITTRATTWRQTASDRAGRMADLRLERDELKGRLAVKKSGAWLLEMVAAARTTPAAEPDTPTELMAAGGSGAME